MSKVLFFDIDGTLYDFSGYMPASTIEALKQARENGHKLIICSGRVKYQIYPELFSLFDGLIGATGAYIEEDGNVLSEHFVSREVLEQVVDVAERAGAKLAAMTKEHLVLNEQCRDFIVEQFRLFGSSEEHIRRVMGDYELTDRIHMHTDIQKLLYYDSKKPLEWIARELESICDVTASSFEQKAKTDGEITMKNINKSYGMKTYIEMHGIGSEDTFAFGDGPNDLDMLEYAGVGIAMGNARQELKKLADYVTKDVSEDGIFYAMSHFGLI